MALPLSQAFTARSLGVMWDNYKASLALPPYLGRQKFGTTKQDSLEMRYILGENSQPISLKASNFDAQAELRDVGGFRISRTKCRSTESPTWLQKKRSSSMRTISLLKTQILQIKYSDRSARNL